MSYFDPLQYGAKANGTTLDTKAVQAAIDAAHKNGGGTVLFRPGKVYLSGSIVLKSNVYLHVEQGSLLQCSHNFEDITERWPGGKQLPTHRGQIYSGSFITCREGTQNIGITGSGVIDGGAAHDNYRGPDRGTHYEPPDQRPFLLFLIGVNGVTIRDTTFRESAFWTVRLSGCEDVLITGIRIRGNLKLPNCDGIDLDRCRRCRVSDCDIICADDGVSIKGCREFEHLGGCEDIVVTNCTIVTKSSALVIGVDASCPLRNVTFNNCVIRDSNRGLSVNLGEDSLYENILFNGIIVETRVWSHQWWGRGEPIYVSATAWEDKLGSIRNVRFTNVLARSECGVYLASDKLGDVEGIVLDNVRLELGPWSGSKHPEEQGGEYDRRPTSGKRQVYRPEEGIAGYHLENIKNVTIKNSEVIWSGGGDEYFSNAVWARGCQNLKVDVDGAAKKSVLKAIDIA